MTLRNQINYLVASVWKHAVFWLRKKKHHKINCCKSLLKLYGYLTI